MQGEVSKVSIAQDWLSIGQQVMSDCFCTTCLFVSLFVFLHLLNCLHPDA